MHNCRLIRILKSLNPEELNLFGDFLRSPFFKRKRNTLGLYNYLLDLYPIYKEELVDELTVFNRLYPGKKFNSRVIQNLILDLTKSAENFLSQITYQNDQNAQNDKLDYLFNLSKGYHDRHMIKEAARVNDIIETELKKSALPQKDYITKKKNLCFLKLRYYEERQDFVNLWNCVEDLFKMNAFQYVLEYIDTIKHREIFKKNFKQFRENKFVKDILDQINTKKLIEVFEKEGYADSPDLALNVKLHHYKLNAVRNDKSDEHYYLFKNLLMDNISNLNRAERCLFFSDLLDYCAGRQTKEFYAEGLSVFKKMYDTGSFSPSEKQYCDFTMYRNIILFSNSQKDDQWFNDLAEKYIHVIHPDYRENLKHFAYSDFYFRNKDFDKALEHNSKITQDFFFYKVDVRYLLLKIYYELNLIDEAIHLLKVFKSFIKNNSDLSDFFKEVYSLFLDPYEELLKIKLGKSTTRLSVFKDRVEEASKISYMPWIMEKVNELVEKQSKLKNIE